MSKLGNAQDRALELIGELGTGIRKAVPGKAMQWVETGAALGAVRTGTRIAGKFVRRNPVLAGVAIAGAGLLWFAARQRANALRQQTDAGIDPREVVRQQAAERQAAQAAAARQKTVSYRVEQILAEDTAKAE